MRINPVKQWGLAKAQAQTMQAESALASLGKILQDALQRPDVSEWICLMLKKVDEKSPPDSFDKPKPEKKKLLDIPSPPQESDRKANIGWREKLFPQLSSRELERVKKLYEHDYRLWELENAESIRQNKEIENTFLSELAQWEKERVKWEEDQKACQANKVKKQLLIEATRRQYLARVPGALEEFFGFVLSLSEYSFHFMKEFSLEHNLSNKIVIVEYTLPSVDDLPKIKEVKFIPSSGLRKILLSESALKKLYDDVIYQMALRTVHELFYADTIEVIDGVVFNGWVNSIDKATGQNIKPCIISLQVSRTEFMAIDLSKVDPKTCFKSLKGVGSSQLHNLTPIAPILNISREDKRFVPSYNVADALTDTVNLAALDWEDFEHLIRGLFEKEFSVVGGEVKITRASRDSGVDAVAFDPDPIRGGKIVIQAKRYTNTVGVSAVRDLYGTVMNEGANKGILVTTTDYGPDAYDFAKGKPLTLLSGSNLLHLLEKHGHKAMIDIKAAKKILSEKVE